MAAISEINRGIGPQIAQKMEGLKFGIVPVGRFLPRIVRLDQQTGTREALAETNERLESENILILAKHWTYLDMITTAYAFAANLEKMQRVVMPMAASLLNNFPVLNDWIKEMNQVDGVQVLPIVREKDVEKYGMDPSFNSVKTYLKAVEGALREESGSVVVVAPQAERSQPWRKISKVNKKIAELATRGIPIINAVAEDMISIPVPKLGGIPLKVRLHLGWPRRFKRKEKQNAVELEPELREWVNQQMVNVYGSLAESDL
jgi:1-acyl-sn-glycerol-3-phosphate acyltransferase